MSKTYNCKVCEKEFTGRSSMYSHQRECIKKRDLQSQQLQIQVEEKDLQITELKKQLQEKDLQIAELKKEEHEKDLQILILKNKIENKNEVITTFKENIEIFTSSMPQNIDICGNYIPQEVMNTKQSVDQPKTKTSLKGKTYLEKYCEDPYTIKELLDKVDYELDLAKRDTNFFHNYTAKIFDEIPIEKIPLRCSDKNRKTFYEFKNGKWEINDRTIDWFMMDIQGRLWNLFKKKYKPEKTTTYDLKEMMNSKRVIGNQDDIDDLRCKICAFTKTGRKKEWKELSKFIIDKIEINKD